MEKNEQTLEIKPYTPKEMRNFFGVSKYVFNNMIKKHSDELGERTGKFFTVNQVEIIFKRLGIPRKIIISD